MGREPAQCRAATTTDRQQGSRAKRPTSCALPTSVSSSPASAQESSEAAQRERERLEALLAALHEGVLIVDRSGQIAMLNDAARRILGLGAAVETSFDAVTSLDLRRPDMTYLPTRERPLSRAMQGDAFADSRWSSSKAAATFGA